MLEALLNLKAAIENAGGKAKLTIEIEDKDTYKILKEKLLGIFLPTNVAGEIEGLDGIKIWKDKN